MPQITATFASTDVIRIDEPEATWFILGAPPGTPLNGFTAAGDMEGLCTTHGNAAVVRITTADRPTVSLSKALFSSREVFWAIRSNGDVVVADHIRNVLAHLDVHERSPSDLTLAAHYLTRRPHMPMTISGSVQRLEFGHRIDIGVLTGSVTRIQIARVTDRSVKRPEDEYLAAVDQALHESIDQIRGPQATALMFSGGVDSTLLLALDPEAMQPVTFVPDTPEFADETVYARRASEFFDIEPNEVPVPETQFVELLEEATDAAGVPIFSDAGPYYHRIYTLDGYDTFIDGHGADNAFGSSLKLARVSNAFRFTPSRQILEQLAPRVPGHLGYRLDQVSSRASGFARDPWDPEGWAGDTRTYGDLDLLGEIFGPQTLTEVKERQLASVKGLVDGVGSTSNRFLAHLEIHHWMGVFTGSTIQARLSTTGMGKRCIGPYSDWRVLTTLSQVPLEDRYVIGLQAKWMLKRLLQDKVPDYPIDQRKKTTALPFRRFYTDGPLTGIWDHYPVPDIFTGEIRRQVIDEPTVATWTAITHAIWDERIRKNPNLQLIGVVESYTRSVG